MSFDELKEAILLLILDVRRNHKCDTVSIYVGQDEWTTLMNECRYENGSVLDFSREVTLFNGHPIYNVNQRGHLAVHPLHQ